MRNAICRLLCRDDRTKKEQITDGYLQISDSAIAKMSNGELALWQSNHQNEPSKVILAEQEWQNRRLARQIRAQLTVAVIGVSGGLAGVMLGWYLKSLDVRIVQEQSEGNIKRNQKQEQDTAKQERPPVAANPSPALASSPQKDRTEAKKERADEKPKGK